MHACTHTHMHVRTHAHTHTYTHTHTHTHTHTQHNTTHTRTRPHTAQYKTTRRKHKKRNEKLGSPEPTRTLRRATFKASLIHGRRLSFVADAGPGDVPRFIDALIVDEGESESVFASA